MARAIIKGVPISPGIAIGPVLLLPDSRISERRTISESEIAGEVAALEEAHAQACAIIERTASRIPGTVAEFGDILASQLELLRDPRILNGAAAKIRNKKLCASWAIHEAIADLTAIFQGIADPYLNERVQDIRSIGSFLVDALSGVHRSRRPNWSGILAAWDIAPPTLFEQNAAANIKGLLTVDGGPTSHMAILARALKIPAVASLEDLNKSVGHGEKVIVDGYSGNVVIDPDEEDIAKYSAIAKQQADFDREAIEAAQWLPITRDGKYISVLANIDNSTEIPWLQGSGAEGIGLYRTEFAYLSGSLPTEEDLVAEYLDVIRGAGGNPVIFRTLDVGADKILSSQHALREPNPALGLRGIRFCLHNEEIFRTQLRAILRAGKDANFSIMLPLITTLDEIRQVRQLLQAVQNELAEEGLPHASDPPLGIMLETPAAVWMARELAEESAFISLGTNDLLHYLMAIDRNNRHVSYLHEPFNPAFLRCIDQVVKDAHAKGKKVCVCGEMAADPPGIAILVGLGVDTFSVTPRFVPAVKHLLRKLDSRLCQEIAAAALKGAEAAQTREKLGKLLASSMNAALLFSNSVALCRHITPSRGEAEAFFQELLESTRR